MRPHVSIVISGPGCLPHLANTVTDTHEKVDTCKMAAHPPTSADGDAAGAHTPPTVDELAQALKVEVYDREGKTKTLGELVQGTRSVLLFTRHFCKFNLGRECDDHDLRQALHIFIQRMVSPRDYPAPNHPGQ